MPLFLGKVKAFPKPPSPLQASTCIPLARAVPHGHTGSLIKWALSSSSLQNDWQREARNACFSTKGQCLPQLNKARENAGDGEISWRGWNYLDGILKDFTKQTHTHTQRQTQAHKSKLWVEITSRISCLQKRSHLYNTLSHFYALENFHPWQKSSDLWNRIWQWFAMLHAGILWRRLSEERETTFTGAKLQKQVMRIEHIYLKTLSLKFHSSPLLFSGLSSNKWHLFHVSPRHSVLFVDVVFIHRHTLLGTHVLFTWNGGEREWRGFYPLLSSSQ